MVLLSNLKVGYVYFYTIEASIGIAEYIEEWHEDTEYLDGGFTERYLTDIWSDDNFEYNTYLSNASDDIIILKELCSVNKEYDIITIIEDLKEEFPEYFI